MYNHAFKSTDIFGFFTCIWQGSPQPSSKIDRNEAQWTCNMCILPFLAHEEGDMQPQNDEAHRYDEDTIRHSFDKIG